jgi:hypothetical protein
MFIYFLRQQWLRERLYIHCLFWSVCSKILITYFWGAADIQLVGSKVKWSNRWPLSRFNVWKEWKFHSPAFYMLWCLEKGGFSSDMSVRGLLSSVTSQRGWELMIFKLRRYKNRHFWEPNTYDTSAPKSKTHSAFLCAGLVHANIKQISKSMQ